MILLLIALSDTVLCGRPTHCQSAWIATGDRIVASSREHQLELYEIMCWRQSRTWLRYSDIHNHPKAAPSDRCVLPTCSSTRVTKPDNTWHTACTQAHCIISLLVGLHHLCQPLHTIRGHNNDRGREHGRLADRRVLFVLLDLTVPLTRMCFMHMVSCSAD